MSNQEQQGTPLEGILLDLSTRETSSANQKIHDVAHTIATLCKEEGIFRKEDLGLLCNVVASTFLVIQHQIEHERVCIEMEQRKLNRSVNRIELDSRSDEFILTELFVEKYPFIKRVTLKNWCGPNNYNRHLTKGISKKVKNQWYVNEDKLVKRLKRNRRYKKHFLTK